MSPRRRWYHPTIELPDGMDAADIEPILAVLLEAYPRIGRDQCLRWLLGDRVVDDAGRVLIDAARRASRLRLAACRVRADIGRGRYDRAGPNLR